MPKSTIIPPLGSKRADTLSEIALNYRTVTHSACSVVLDQRFDQCADRIQLEVVRLCKPSLLVLVGPRGNLSQLASYAFSLERPQGSLPMLSRLPDVGVTAQSHFQLVLAAAYSLAKDSNAPKAFVIVNQSFMTYALKLQDQLMEPGLRVSAV